MTDTTDMSGRIVVITGSGGGVGKTVTLRWLGEGAKVLAVDHGIDSLTKLKAVWQEQPNADPSRLAVFAADVTTEAGTAAMVAEAQRAFGSEPDTLLHLVGGFAMAAVDSPEAPAVWEKMIALNLSSSFHAYRAMLPVLKRRGCGWIVGLGSRVGVQPAANLAAYAASKAGLLALTQALSEEVKGDNIHVNLVLASTIDTPANRAAMGEEEALNWVQPDDIADATFYLCSPRARAVFGATLELYARA